MSDIEKLYYNMDKLSDNWRDFPETKRANEALMEKIGKTVYTKCEDEICDCMAENEKQGFIKGFQYAISLLTNGKGGAVA